MRSVAICGARSRPLASEGYPAGHPAIQKTSLSFACLRFRWFNLSGPLLLDLLIELVHDGLCKLIGKLSEGLAQDSKILLINRQNKLGGLRSPVGEGSMGDRASRNDDCRRPPRALWGVHHLSILFIFSTRALPWAQFELM